MTVCGSVCYLAATEEKSPNDRVAFGAVKVRELRPGEGDAPEDDCRQSEFVFPVSGGLQKHGTA